MSCRTLALASVLLTAASLAGAEAGSRWSLLGFSSDHACELTVAGQGPTLQIRATGLVPGETLRLGVVNGDMKPIAYSLRASSDGTMQRYYLPFRFNADPGLVDITLDAARCTLEVSVPWTRAPATIL